MESVVWRSHLHPTFPLLSLGPRPRPRPPPPSTFKPHSPLKALTPLRTSRNPPISSPLSTAAAALAAAAALLSLRLHRPSPSLAAAAPPVAAQSETLPSPTDADKERTLKSHLESHSDDIRGLRALKEIVVEFDYFTEAIAIVDRLTLLAPDTTDLPLMRAYLQSYSGNTDSAKQGFEALLAKDPFLIEAYHGLVMTTSQTDEGAMENILHRVESAMEACRKEKPEEDVRKFKLLVAQIRAIEGKYEEALKVYQELVEEEPTDFRPYLCEGIIYMLTRKEEEAEEQFLKFRRLIPKSHPCVQYFDDNMIAKTVLSQVDETERQVVVLKS